MSNGDNDGFSFPQLPAPSPPVRRVPLTARATVVDRGGESGTASSTTMAPPLPRPVAVPVQKAAAARPGKIPLEKGYSQMDWLRITRTHPDLADLKGAPMRRKISLEEVKQHRTQDDAWMVYNGKVYNMTPYIRFHPGGLKYIMMGAGRDATALFNKFHAWVNIDFMMSKCMVGLLESPADRALEAETVPAAVSETAQKPAESAAVADHNTGFGPPEGERIRRTGDDRNAALSTIGCRGVVENVGDQVLAAPLRL